MTDIVEKLRFRDAGEDADRLIEIMHEAADEIERLRGEVSYLTDAAIPALRNEIERLRAVLLTISDLEPDSECLPQTKIARAALGDEK